MGEFKGLRIKLGCMTDVTSAIGVRSGVWKTLRTIGENDPVPSSVTETGECSYIENNLKCSLAAHGIRSDHLPMPWIV